MSVNSFMLSQEANPKLNLILTCFVFSCAIKGGFIMLCVTTRFHLRYPWHIVSIYFAYKAIQRQLKTAPGLLRYAFLLESPFVCYTFSIWESEQAIQNFSNVENHIQAVRLAKRLCQNVWSAYWQMDAISKYASQWPGTTAWPMLIQHPAHLYRLAPSPEQERIR